MGLSFGSIPGGMEVPAAPRDEHAECRGCAATLTVRLDGALPRPDIRELLLTLGLAPAPPSRVRQLVDAGRSNAEIIAEVPGATENDYSRARAEARSGWAS